MPASGGQPTGAASEERFTRTGTPVRPRAEPAGVAAIEDTEAYRRLTALRRRFTLAASGVFYSIFAAFLILAGWAHSWMATRLYKGLTVGYLLALVVIVSVWVVVLVYSRVSERVFEPLAEQARRDAGQ
jgi:uncharacterized membrane protein (DUF485 family)